MKIKLKETFADTISGKKILAEIADKTTNGLNIDDSLNGLNTSITTLSSNINTISSDVVSIENDIETTSGILHGEIETASGNLQELINNIGSPLTFSGLSSVAEINAITATNQGTVYTMSDSGTITGMGSHIDVEQSDEIAYAENQGWVIIGKDFLYSDYYRKNETSGAEQISTALGTLNGYIETIGSNVTTVSSNIDTISGNLNTVSGNLDAVSGKLDTISGNVDTVNSNIANIENDIETISGYINTISDDVATIENNIEIISGDVDTVNSNLNTVSGHLDTVSSDLNTLSGTVDDIDEYLVSIDETLDNINYDIDYLSASIDAFSGGGGVKVVELDPTTEEPAEEDPSESILYLTDNEDDTYSQWIYTVSGWNKLKLNAEDVEYEEMITPEDIADTVATVNELKEDFDTKITTNFPPAQITKTGDDIDNWPGYQPGARGCLIGSLFNVSFKHPIKIDETLLGVYCSRANDNQSKCILGIYEYQPDYKQIDKETQAVTGYGRTVALCDTGIITLTTGFNEYPIKHLNKTINYEIPETTPELKTNCLYYATVFLSKDNSVSTNPFRLMSAPGYEKAIHEVNPLLVIKNDDSVPIEATVYEGNSGYKEDLCFDDFGFTWCQNHYPNITGDDPEHYYITARKPAEVTSADRFYMQIRNDSNYIPPTPPTPPEPPTPGETSYTLQIEWTQNYTQLVMDSVKIDNNYLSNDSYIDGFVANGQNPNYTIQLSNYTHLFVEDEGNVISHQCDNIMGGIKIQMSSNNKPSTISWKTGNWGSNMPFTAKVYEITTAGSAQIGELTGSQQTSTTYTVNCS